jgi:hypothetical protein
LSYRQKMENFNNHKDCAGVDVAGQLGAVQKAHIFLRLNSARFL